MRPVAGAAGARCGRTSCQPQLAHGMRCRAGQLAVPLTGGWAHTERKDRQLPQVAACLPALMVLSSTTRHCPFAAHIAALGFATPRGASPANWSRSTRPPARLGRPLPTGVGARRWGGDAGGLRLHGRRPSPSREARAPGVRGSSASRRSASPAHRGRDHHVRGRYRDMRDTGLFLSLAEIAGVFVGFGALIAIRRGRARHELVSDCPPSRRWRRPTASARILLFSRRGHALRRGNSRRRASCQALGGVIRAASSCVGSGDWMGSSSTILPSARR